MAFFGKQFMSLFLFFFFFFFLLFLSTQARTFQQFYKQTQQEQPRFYQQTEEYSQHGFGNNYSPQKINNPSKSTPPPSPPSPSPPPPNPRLPPNYNPWAYTTYAESKTDNQANSQEKTVADTYGTPSTEYKPYGSKQVSGKYQQYYDPNSYRPNEVADKSKTTYSPENNEQHNNKKKTVEEEEEQYNTEEDEEELDEEPAKWGGATTFAEKYTPPTSTRNHDQFYYKDMNTESNKNHENNNKKNIDESAGKYQFYTNEQPNPTNKGNFIDNDEELEKYLAEEEDNNVSPQLEDKESSPAAPTKYNPFQNPNYIPYQQKSNNNPSREYYGMSDTRPAGTHYNVENDKFDNPYNYQAKKKKNPYTQQNIDQEDPKKYQSSIGGVDTSKYHQEYKQQQQQAENSSP
ncbi:hypothetical protein CASFOL_039507 [Castilleja foliolosa]|uniref:Uncharacterized protein n=1 Tax=Castilleja foliolosa TaxID=1961234 RepID=A0ABD3BI52_9LAMI